MKDKKYVRCFGRKFNFRRLWPTGALILAVALFSASALYAAQDGPVADSAGSVQDVNVQRKNFTLQKKGNLITLNAQDADVAEVLREIENVSGVKMTIDQRLIGKKVSVKGENKDIEGMLRDILRDQYYVLSYEQDPANKENKILKEAKIKGEVIGSIPLKGKLITVEIPYGSGIGEVRAARESECGSIGPLSFAVDGAGNIYICDTWNMRIQVFSSSGSYLFTIPLREDTFAEDIVVDDHGFVYVYDPGVGKLYQYGKSGQVLSAIDVDSARGVKGPLHLINSAIYFEYCDAEHCSYFVIGRVLSDNTLLKVTYQEQEQDQGSLTLSGRKYKGRKFIEGYNIQMDIIKKDELTSKMLSFPFISLLTAPFLGEDIRGDMYFSRARAEYKYQLYDIDKFDPEGNYIGTVQIPSGQRVFWAVKQFELGRNGNIYNCVPGEKKLTMYIFVNADN